MARLKRPFTRKADRRSGPCQKCGTERRSLHRDHIKPLWAGGADDPSNIQYICANCHQDKTLDEHRSPEFKTFVMSRVTPERREKMRVLHTGRVVSEETRAKLRAANPPGRKMPHVSTRQKAHWADPEWRAKTTASIRAAFVRVPNRSAPPVVLPKVVEAVQKADRPLRIAEVAERSGVKFDSTRAFLLIALQRGLIQRVGRGLYAALAAPPPGLPKGQLKLF